MEGRVEGTSYSDDSDRTDPESTHRRRGTDEDDRGPDLDVKDTVDDHRDHKRHRRLNLDQTSSGPGPLTSSSDRDSRVSSS